MKKIKINIKVPSHLNLYNLSYSLNIKNIEIYLIKLLDIYNNYTHFKHKYYKQSIMHYVYSGCVAGILTELIKHKYHSKQYLYKMNYLFNDTTIRYNYTVFISFESIRQIYNILALAKLYNDQNILKKYISITFNNSKHTLKIDNTHDL